jgi:prepilin-type N-terminal cleavage/methylation domain-containing protein
VLIVRKLLRRMKPDSGFTLVELLVAAAAGSLLLAGAGNFVVGSMKSQVFTTGQSATVNDTRNATLQIEKEIRAATYIVWCAPAGSCIEMVTQTPTMQDRTVKYLHSGGQLLRSLYDPPTSTWSEPQSVIDRVANTGAQPVFACDTTSSLLKVTVDLHIRPTPNSDPTYDVLTSVKPRNFSDKASCP